MSERGDSPAGDVGSLAEETVDVGAEVVLTIERVAPGGHCVAHHAGRVIFVRHALPGERVTARLTEIHARYARADAIEVLAAAPDRVPPPCPYAGPGRCGGCDWQHTGAPGCGTRWTAAAARVSVPTARTGSSRSTSA